MILALGKHAGKTSPSAHLNFKDGDQNLHADGVVKYSLFVSVDYRPLLLNNLL